MHQHQFAQTVDMIGMKVGEKHRLDITGVKSKLDNIAPRARTGINHKQALAGNDYGTWWFAFRIRQGRTGTTQTHMQSVGKVSEKVFFHTFGRCLVQQLLKNLGTESGCQHRKDDDYSHQPNDDFFYAHTSPPKCLVRFLKYSLLVFSFSLAASGPTIILTKLETGKVNSPLMSK